MKKELIKQLEAELEKNSPDFSSEKIRIEAEIPDLLKDLSLDYNIYIAGGAVTSIFSNTDINDFDLYFVGNSNSDLVRFIIQLLSNATIISVTNRSMMLNHRGKLINVVYFKNFSSVEEIFDSFDFTCVMGAYSLKEEEFVLHRDFLKDLSKRELVFNSGTDYPIVSLMRTNKYVDRGYKLTKNTLVAIVLRCMQLNIASYEELESHIGGMYGLDLSSLIDTNEEFNLGTVIQQILQTKKSIDSQEVLRIKETDAVKKRKLLSELFKDVKLTLFKHDNGVFFITEQNRILSIREDLVSHLDKDDLPNQKYLMYKFVKRGGSEGEYVSYWKSDFIYKIGEVAEDTKNGLWGGCLNECSSFPNAQKSDRVLIEIEVDRADIKGYNKGGNKFNFSKCKVIREMNGKYESERDTHFDISDLFPKETYI